MTDPTPTVRRAGPTGGSGTGSGRDRRPAASLGILPEPGERLDGFELLETIGVGGMGAVFRALDRDLDRHVALKVLPMESSDDSEVVLRFYQEGRAAARLDHEGIARVYAIGSDRGFHFIAFEYIEGTNLRQHVDLSGPMAVADVIDHALQVAGALVHAMHRGVVHRDIKPSNIILSPEGRAKLVDMGLARHFERGGDDGLTQTGMTLGTFDYISPEQARDPRDVDVRSDLYSLGCTMYHMLTGRPPFADGTVLQKLLQHQEEPPPDVRDLNPAVPPALAALIRKLMAKDRNRRYQTPEQLGRDLDELAEALGTRPAPAGDGPWGPPARASRWSRPAAWAAAAAALALVAAGLPWLVNPTPDRPGTDPEPPANIGRNMAATAPSALRGAEAREADLAARNDGEAEPPAPRTVPVRTEAELAAALDEVPPGSVIELADSGPFEIRPGVLLNGRDLTLRAAEGVRPSLRLVRGTNPRRAADATIAFFHIVGGRVHFEGLDLELESGYRDDTVIGILAENADVTIRRCTLRRPNYWLAVGRVYGLEVRAAATAEVSPPARVLSSSFEGAIAGIMARGPVDLRISNCTFGLTGSVLRLDRNGAERSAGATVGLRYVTILANDGPVFRFLGAAPRVRVEETVIATSGDRPTTLVVAEEPDRLDWYGRDNLYGRIATYLQPLREDGDFPALRDYASWADEVETPREFGTLVTDVPVWVEDHPGEFLASADSVRSFRVVPIDERSTRPGARQMPGGQSLTAGFGLAGRRLPSPRSAPAPTTTADVPVQIANLVTVPRPAEPEADVQAPVRDPAMTAPMPPADATPVPVAIANQESGEGEPAETPVAAAAAAPVGIAEADRPVPVGTAREFVAAWRTLSPKGGTIVLAPGAVIDLQPFEVRAEGRWKIRSGAKLGEARPTIRFETPAGDPPMERGSAPAWMSLFRLRDGATLLFEGIDVLLPAEGRPVDRRWAAFVVGPGTDLELNDSSVTVAGRRKPSRSAIVALRAAEDDDERLGPVNPANARAAGVRITDSLLRSGDDGIEVAGGRRLTLSMKNVVVSLGGVLLRRTRQSTRDNADAAVQLGLDLRQVTCLVGGGLIHLQNLPTTLDIPVADVVARDSILALTDPEVPLLRIDGRDDPAGLNDPIRWDGHAIAYHGVRTFRQDQPGQMDSPPVKLDRSTWQTAVGRREDAAFFDDVRFARPIDALASPWLVAPDQVRLAKDSPVPQAGADLIRIPTPALTDVGEASR